jgi:hypothetical protein
MAASFSHATGSISPPAVTEGDEHRPASFRRLKMPLQPMNVKDYRSTNSRPGGMAMAVKTTAAIAAASCMVLLIGSAAHATLQTCTGEFALCAATPCRPTGRTIVTNSGHSYQEASCICPVLRGQAVADVTAGNMKGSCAPPAHKGGVWSLFAPRGHIPQAITHWSRLPAKSAAIIQICPASLRLGAQTVNCFSFACTRIKSAHGVKLADCRCPIGQGTGPDGKMLPATTFGIMAGQGDRSYCGKYPVSAPLP